MDARYSRHGGATRLGMTWIACAAWCAAALAAEPAPTSPPDFQPGEISIGEPIALPIGGPPASTEVSGAGALGDDPRSALPPAVPDSDAVPGSGWLGIAVAESTVPGRWRVEEVTAGGPAARAGIAVGDELRAVNGVALSSAEQVSQTLTAIAAGQDVNVAVARADRVSDVVLRAEPRPTVRGPAPRAATAPPPASAPILPPEPVTAATASPPPDSQAGAQPGLPPGLQPGVEARPQWQAAPMREPAPAPPSGSRFGSSTSLDQPAAPAATPFARDMLPSAPERSVTVPPPATPPAVLESRGDARRPGRIALGVRTVAIDPATQARFNLSEPAGAYVIGVVQELPAAKAGVPPGSVIVALGDRPVRSPLELTRLVANGPIGRPVPVQFVLPGGEAKQANVVLQSLDAPLERALTGGAEPAAPADLVPAPQPRRAERPANAEADIRSPGLRAEVRSEIRALRARLERLERLLDPTSRPARE